MQREKDKIYSDTYKGFFLVERTSENQSYNKRNLDSSIKVIESAFNQYANLIQMHFTIRFPQTLEVTDKEAREYIAKFHKHLMKGWNRTLPESKRSRGKLRYIEAIEIEKAKSIHIHFMTWCTADRNRPSGIVELVNKAWEKALDADFVRGLVEYSYEDSKELKSAPEAVQESVKWASYLCKSRGKQANTVCFSSSRG